MNKKAALVSIVLFALYLGVALFFTNRESGETLCSGVKIRVDEVEMNSLVDTVSIAKEIKSRFGSFQGVPVTDIDTDSIVSFLRKLDQVKDAGVYFSQSGVMYVTIEQHKPLFRVLPSNGKPFAIDDEGRVMAIRGVAPFRSIVVTGNVTREKAMGEVKDLVLFIENDGFWSAMFEQIEIDSQGDYILIPKIANFKVRLGDLSALESKMENFRLYLEQGTQLRGWDMYKEINLKFRNQVIGVK